MRLATASEPSRLRLLALDSDEAKLMPSPCTCSSCACLPAISAPAPAPGPDHWPAVVVWPGPRLESEAVWPATESVDALEGWVLSEVRLLLRAWRPLRLAFCSGAGKEERKGE